MVAGEVPEHPLQGGGRKGHQLDIKMQKSDKTLHILSTFLDGPIKPHCRVMVDGKTCPAIFRDRLIPSSQISRSVTVTFAFLRRIGAASYR